jgi:hypothetical protein
MPDRKLVWPGTSLQMWAIRRQPREEVGKWRMFEASSVGHRPDRWVSSLGMAVVMVMEEKMVWVGMYLQWVLGREALSVRR